MNKSSLIVSLLILFSSLSITGAPTGAPKTRDAFVLVDVSGTMNNNTINQEAKQIIREYLMGNRSLDSWANSGWKKDDNWDTSIPSSIIEIGSKVCLIPFGDINRVQDRIKHTVSDMNEFKSWYNSSYPTVFQDGWTYLTLAHAYVGSVALTENISRAYVIVYTDGMPESVNKQYDATDQRRVDEYQHANAMRKMGILRKQVNDKHFDIEIWDFTINAQIKTNEEGNTGSITPPPPPIDPKKFKITNPKNDGLNEKHAISVYQEEPVSLGWNESGASIIISQKKDGSWKRISGKNARNFYSIKKQANSAKITFLESGEYKIVARGEHGSDERYVEVSFDIWKVLLPTLLVVLLIIGGVGGYQKFFKKQDNWDDEPQKKPQTGATSTNDDW